MLTPNVCNLYRYFLCLLTLCACEVVVRTAVPNCNTDLITVTRASSAAVVLSRATHHWWTCTSCGTHDTVKLKHNSSALQAKKQLFHDTWIFSVF